MSLAKRLKAKPRDVANTLVENLDVGTVFAAPEVRAALTVRIDIKMTNSRISLYI